MQNFNNCNINIRIRAKRRCVFDNGQTEFVSIQIDKVLFNTC